MEKKILGIIFLALGLAGFILLIHTAPKEVMTNLKFLGIGISSSLIYCHWKQWLKKQKGANNE